MLMTGQKDNSVAVLQIPCFFEKQTYKVLRAHGLEMHIIHISIL